MAGADRLGSHVAVYRRLLLLYPARFRGMYGGEMAQVFRDRLREERSSGRFGRIARLWIAVCADLASTVPREWVDALIHGERRGLLSREGRPGGMFRFIVRRLLYAIPVLLVASIVVFVVIRSTIDPVAGEVLNPRVRPADIARLRQTYGLDRPLYIQYWAWLSHFVRADWGTSLLSNRPVFPEVRTALGNTMILGLAGTALSLVLGIGIGMISSLRQYTWFDNLATGGAFLGLSIPNFWLALLLQVFFGLYLTSWLHLGKPIFAIAGMRTPGTTGFDLIDRLRHMGLPVIVLSVQEIAIYSRYMRASMLEVLNADYLRTARAKGLTERRVVFRHGMRNALIPITTVASLSIGSIAGGLIITEAIFEWPGMGRLFVDSFTRGDYLVVLPWLMVTVAFVVLFNLMADIAYALLDPRIRYR